MSLQALLVEFTKLTYKFCSLPCPSRRMCAYLCPSVCGASALQWASTLGYSPRKDRSMHSRQNGQHLFLSLPVKCNGEKNPENKHQAMELIQPSKDQVLLQKIKISLQIRELLVRNIQEKYFLLVDVLWIFFINLCLKPMTSQHCKFIAILS